MYSSTHRANAEIDVEEGKRLTLVPHPGWRADIRHADIGLTDTERRGAVEILNAVLSDEFLLYTKTRGFHWNVEGPNFPELHALFQKQYEQLEQIIDDVAERARSLGGIAASSLEEYLDLARLEEESGRRHDARGMIAALLTDHEKMIRSLRADIESCSEDHGDDGTTDFLTGLMRVHEKIAWMLRAYLA